MRQNRSAGKNRSRLPYRLAAIHYSRTDELEPVAPVLHRLIGSFFHFRLNAAVIDKQPLRHVCLLLCLNCRCCLFRISANWTHRQSALQIRLVVPL